MTISDLARFSMQRQQYEKREVTANLPNGSDPPPGHVNPFEDPSRNITGKTHWKIIPVSEEVTQKLKDIVMDHTINNYGMSGDDDSLPETIKAYVQTVPAEERSDTVWTLHRIFHAEAKRVADIIRAHNPGWQYGQPFDTSIFDDELQNQTGFDMRA